MVCKGYSLALYGVKASRITPMRPELLMPAEMAMTLSFGIVDCAWLATADALKHTEKLVQVDNTPDTGALTWHNTQWQSC